MRVAAIVLFSDCLIEELFCLLRKCAGERAAKRRREVKRRHHRRLDRGEGSRGKDRRQGVRDPYRDGPIAAAHPFVLLERLTQAMRICALPFSEAPPPGHPPLAELLGQFMSVAQPQIEPLACHGVKCLGSIPNPDLRLRPIRIDQILSRATTQRHHLAMFDFVDFNVCPERAAECTMECRDERLTKGLGIRLGSLLCDGFGRTPHQCPTIRFRKRKNGQWAFRREKLECLALNPPAEVDLGQQSRLTEISNVRFWPWIAIGMNQQGTWLRSSLEFRRSDDTANPATLERCLETLDQCAVADDMAQSAASQILSSNPDPPRVVTQRDFDGGDLTVFDRKLGDSFNQSPRSGRNRQWAPR